MKHPTGTFHDNHDAKLCHNVIAHTSVLFLCFPCQDRKKTLKQVDEFVNTKVAPKELVDEIKQIGKALLPPTTTSKALPAPTEASSEPAPSNSTVEKPEPPPQINSVPQTEVKTDPFAGISRPLSPYSAYPDLKPPTSPSPSQPQGQINSLSQTEVKAESVSGISSPLSPYPTIAADDPSTQPSSSEPQESGQKGKREAFTVSTVVLKKKRIVGKYKQLEAQYKLELEVRFPDEGSTTFALMELGKHIGPAESSDSIFRTIDKFSLAISGFWDSKKLQANLHEYNGFC
ncbi:hypothetical protein Tsubulata_026361 [Turnera subulata]|uniref:Uncharacterized protein n=1 Tax=Turnera subulata TaxID=218843 RepID=A0A9Q0FT03_9ROSI|nr:hypothetical protein Tsubulata_026361 [Turnera subulata]